MFKKKKYVFFVHFLFYTLLYFSSKTIRPPNPLHLIGDHPNIFSSLLVFFSYHQSLSLFIAKWWFANFMSRKRPDLKFRECWKMKPFGKLPSIKALFPAQYLFHVSAGIQSNLHILPAFQTKVELLMKSYSIFHHSTYVLFHISFHSSLIPSFTTKLNSWL